MTFILPFSYFLLTISICSAVRKREDTDDGKVVIYLVKDDQFALSSPIYPYDKSKITRSGFQSEKRTVIIIPGYQAPKDSVWIQHLSNKLLHLGTYNVFIAEWYPYQTSKFVLQYFSAIPKAKKIGIVLSEFISQLQGLNYSLENIHLIGHSLGAHIAGSAGCQLKGQIRRITGLDPAGLGIEGTSPQNRLDVTDAKFVDVIHSNGGDLGIVARSGHVDFYPNGGRYQTPNCGLWIVVCSHNIGNEYYVNSVDKPCLYKARQCESYDVFKANKCQPCREGGNCTYLHMGFHADKWPHSFPATTGFYLDTTKNQKC